MWPCDSKFPLGGVARFISFAALMGLALPAFAAHPGNSGSPGARVSADQKSTNAALLWSEGQLAFNEGRYSEAAELLARFIKNHAGATGFLDAHLLLGRARLELGEAGGSIPPLRYYVSGSRLPLQTAEGRLWLGQAYLGGRKFHEAYFMGLEVEKGSYPEKPELRPRAQILMADAQIALGQLDRANAASTQARQSITALSPPESRRALEGDWLRLQVDLKTKACAQLPVPGPLTEDQARSQIERRGLCILEALNLFHELLGRERETLEARVATKLDVALRAYSNSCDNPPEPPPLKDELHPRGRSSEEKARYRTELAELLNKVCTDKLQSAEELLKSWRANAFSTSVKAIDRLLPLTLSLRSTAKIKPSPKRAKQ